jgi:hypothetical protein
MNPFRQGGDARNSGRVAKCIRAEVQLDNPIGGSGANAGIHGAANP